MVGLIHGFDLGRRGDDVAFGNHAGQVFELELAEGAPVVGEEQGFVVTQFAVVRIPFVVDFFGVAFGVLGFKLGVDGFENAGEIVFDGEVTVGTMDVDFEGGDDHVADAQVLGRFEDAAGGEALIAASDGETFADGLEGFGFGPGLDFKSAAKGFAFGNGDGEGGGFFAQVAIKVEGAEVAGQGVVGLFAVVGEGEGEGFVDFGDALVGGEAEENPGVAEGGAPVAIGFAGFVEVLGEEFGLFGEAEVGAGDELQTFDGLVAEPIAFPGIFRFGCGFEEFADLCGGGIGQTHGEGQEGTRGVGEFVATGVEGGLIGRLGFAGFCQCVEGEGGVVERLGFGGVGEVEVAQLVAQPGGELVDALLGDDDAIFFGFDEGEATVGAGPEFGGFTAGPVGEATGFGLHGQETFDAALDGGAGFVFLQQLREEGFVFAEGQPGKDAAGGLLDATVRILKHVFEGVAGFGDARLTEVEAQFAFGFEELGIDFFGEVAAVFAGEGDVVDFTQGGSGMSDFEGGHHRVGKGFVAVPFGGFGGPLPAGGAGFGEADGEGDGGGLVGFEGDEATFAAMVGGDLTVGFLADQDEGAAFSDEFGGVVELEFNFDLTAMRGGVVDDGFDEEFVVAMGEARNSGFDHEGFVDGERGFGGAKAVGTMHGDGHDAVAGEVVGDFEGVGEFAFGVGDEIGLPEGGGDKVFAKEVVGAGFIAAAANDDALVATVAGFEGLGNEGVDGGVVGDREGDFGIEFGEGIGSGVAHQAEDAFIDGVEGDFGIGNGFLRGVFNGGGDGEFAGGKDGVLGGLEVDDEFFLDGFDLDFAVADLVFGHGIGLRTGVGAANEDDGNEGVGGVDFFGFDGDDGVGR